jgi:hypothetical protein
MPWEVDIMAGKYGKSQVIAYSALREIERAVREHKTHIRQRYSLRTRFIVTEGARPLDEKVSIQCYRVVADKPVIVAEDYDVYPNRGASCMQVTLLSLIARIDTQLDIMAQKGELPWLAPGDK